VPAFGENIRAWRRFYGLATFTLALLFSSCSHYYYSPGVQNVPMLREKGEVQFTGAIATGPESRIRQVQFAAAVHDYAALMGSFMSVNGRTAFGRNSAHATYQDLAFGTFVATETGFHAEAFGGVGVSTQSHVYETGTDQRGTQTEPGRSSMWFAKFFLQPTFGLATDWVDIGFTNKVAMVTFDRVDSYLPQPVEPLGAELSAVGSLGSGWFYEPAFTLKLGFRYVKLFTQFATSFQVNKPKIRAERYSLGIGMQVSIAKRHKKKDQENEERDQ
jgi:hypothetical protein